MDMVVRLKAMENNFISILICLIILFCGCQNSNSNTYKLDNKPTKQVCNEYDTTVNNSIIMNNAESVVNELGNTYDKMEFDKGDRVYVLSSNKKLYLAMGANYGGLQNEYKDFSVGNVSNQSFQVHSYEPKNHLDSIKYILSLFDSFQTESGIKLGIPESQLKDIAKTKSWELKKEQTDSTTIYRYENKYCMYEAKYIFRQDKLNKFSFGYITP